MTMFYLKQPEMVTNLNASGTLYYSETQFIRSPRAINGNLIRYITIALLNHHSLISIRNADINFEKRHETSISTLNNNNGKKNTAGLGGRITDGVD